MKGVINFNARPIAKVLGAILAIVAISMVFCVPFSLYYGGEDIVPILSSIGLTTLAAGLLFGLNYKEKPKINKREGYIIVVFGWLFLGLFSALPYLFSGVLISIPDALFESYSGLTTTGASVISEIEAMPKGILFWRSLTQWIGGMGIIVLTVALFPLLGIAGIELFVAEAPGPTSDKIHPRIKETAKRLWLIYVGFTFLLFLILWAEGMTGYDAINHALTTMATGGFSTKNNSIAYYDNKLIQYTIILFMFIAGTNYTVLYFGIKGKFKKMWNSEEFRLYIYLTLAATIALMVGFYGHNGGQIEKAFRDSIFAVLTLVTTTGFATEDFTAVADWMTLLTFLLIFVGACAGSTAGGIKLIRHLVLFKNGIYEFKRILHPRGIIRLKVNNEIVAPKIVTHIMVFLIMYFLIFVIGSLLLTMMGVDFLSSIGAVATCVSNVGPGLNEVSPVNNFSGLPDAAKLLLSFIMVLGRLEIFTVLILFTSYFWKAN